VSRPLDPDIAKPEIARRRLQKVKEEIAEAARASGRDPGEVTLLAVSKTFPAETVAAFQAAGQNDFGESYLKEALEKIEALPPATWHYIGRLQTNKVRRVPGFFSYLHSLESLSLAEKLNALLLENGQTLKVYVQVSVSGEASKSGLKPADLPAFLDKLAAFPALIPAGLMTMPPYDPDPEKSRPYYRALRELRDKFAPSLKGLSMGMSLDFKVAVTEGSTVVRIGTALFGDRGL
jgi:pyridoxal phosphate enzyme (YggS family)